MTPRHRPLEPDRHVQEAWLAATARFALDHVADLDAAPAVGALGAEGERIAANVSVPIPEEPLPGGIEAALDVLRRAVGASLTTPGPGYFAFIPGGGLYATALADFASDCFNRFTGLAAAAPALARLEGDVLAWLAREFGYGSDARGLFTSGSSLANFSAVVTARETLVGPEHDLRRAVAYTSSQAHHSVRKSLRLAGIPASNLRLVPVDARFRMDVDALATAIAADRVEGLRPFLIAAAAGTTNTGAVDPLLPLAELRDREALWLHVDAAYGGGFVLCEEGRRRLAGIERADSIAFDPHKGMFLPYGTGCLLVKRGDLLRRAHREEASYLQDFDDANRGEEIPSATEYGPELSRSYRGLRTWLPLMLHGARAFRDAVAEKLALAAELHDGLVRLQQRGAPLEIVAPPQLSIVAFRLARREGEPLADWNARNSRLNDAVNARKRTYTSSTSLPVADGAAFTLRACILSFRTHEDRIRAFLEDLEASLAEGT